MSLRKLTVLTWGELGGGWVIVSSIGLNKIH